MTVKLPEWARKTRDGRPSKLSRANQVRIRMNASRISICEMAKLLGLSRSVVAYWSRQNGITFAEYVQPERYYPAHRKPVMPDTAAVDRMLQLASITQQANAESEAA